MRKCLRCEADMIENCDLKVEGMLYGLTAAMSTNRMFAGRIGKPNVAICPECGEVSVYIKSANLVKQK